MRAVLLLHDLDDQRLRAAHDWCRHRGHEPVAVVRDLAGAEAMVRAGDADVLVVVSRADLPIRLEIITVEIVVRPPPGSTRGRRPRPLR